MQTSTTWDAKSFREHWNVQYNARSTSWSWKFAFRYSFVRSTHKFLREGPSTKTQMRVALQHRAFPNVKMSVPLQQRASIDHRPTRFAQWSNVLKYSFGRSTPRFYREGWFAKNQRTRVSLQFCAIDTAFLTRRLRDSKRNARFATVSGDRQHVFSEGCPRLNEICVFATVLGDRHHVFIERVAFWLTLPIPPGGIEK